MSNAVTLYSMPDMERMASAIVKSNLFGIKTVDQGLTLMLIAQAEGLHPAAAARDYHIIQGRPALKADQHPVIKTPDHKCPRSPVPEAGERPHDEKVPP